MAYDSAIQSTNTYGSDSVAVSNLISGFNWGGMRGKAAATCIAAQLGVEYQNYLTAKSYYQTNHQDFLFWNGLYQPLLAPILNEAITRPWYTTGVYTPQYGALDYLASTGRGQSKASVKLDREWFNTRRRASKYHIGYGRRIDYKFAMARFNSELEGWNLGFRYEDHRKQMYDEQRHAHRTEILNIGIGVGQIARRGLATAVETLNESRSRLGSEFGSIGNGLATTAMYQNGQQDRFKNSLSMNSENFANKLNNRMDDYYKSHTPKVSNYSTPDVTQQQINQASRTS